MLDATTSFNDFFADELEVLRMLGALADMAIESGTPFLELLESGHEAAVEVYGRELADQFLIAAGAVLLMDLA